MARLKTTLEHVRGGEYVHTYIFMTSSSFLDGKYECERGRNPSSCFQLGNPNPHSSDFHRSQRAFSHVLSIEIFSQTMGPLASVRQTDISAATICRYCWSLEKRNITDS